MKTKTKIIKKTIPFAEVPINSLFIFDGQVYIKLNNFLHTEIAPNAVCIGDEGYQFNQCCEVIFVRELSVEV